MEATVSVKNLFTRNSFSIPGYQRLYSWGAPQIEALLGDIAEHHDSKFDDPYLLNAILTYDDKERTQLVDGQQRVTTIYLFFAAARAHGGNHLTGTRRSALERLLFDLENDSAVPKVLDQYANGAANAFLKQLAEAKPVQVPDRSQISYPLYRGYSVILTWLQERYPVDETGNVDSLWEFVDHVLEKVRVADIRVGSSQAAWKAFERANDRGKPLEPSDLLKSDLFNEARSDEERVHVAAEWKRLFDAIRAFSAPVDAGTFLHHLSLADLAQSKIPKGAVRELWRSEVISGRRSAHDVAKALADAAQVYGLLLEGRRPSGATCVPLADMAYTPRLKRFRQVRPILLAARALPDADFDAVALACENFAVVVAVTEERGQSYEGELFEAARRLRQDIAEAGSQLEGMGVRFAAGVMQPIIQKRSAEFLQALRPATSTSLQSDFVKYLLFRMETFLAEVAQPGTTRQLFRERRAGAASEHILPRSLNAEAVDELGVPTERAAQLVNLVGNLTLWKASPNSAHQDSPFREKRGDYGQSDFLITKALGGGLVRKGREPLVAEYISPADAWTEDALLRRQGECARLLGLVVGMDDPGLLDGASQQPVLLVPTTFPTFPKATHLVSALRALDAGAAVASELVRFLDNVTTPGVASQALNALEYLGLAEQSDGHGSRWSLTELGQALAAETEVEKELAHYIAADQDLHRIVDAAALEKLDGPLQTKVAAARRVLDWVGEQAGQSMHTEQMPLLP
jgi:hypothetical protein